MRNSLLTKEFCAEDLLGLNLIPKIRFLIIYNEKGREAFPVQRSRRVTDCGALGSENVGMSNRNQGESP